MKINIYEEAREEGRFSGEKPFSPRQILASFYWRGENFFNIFRGNSAIYLWVPAYACSPWSMSSYGKQIASYFLRHIAMMFCEC